MNEDSDLADVSVIMPAYRSRDTIEAALESVLAQTRRPRQIIVVDDGSPDDTAAVANGMRLRMGAIDLRVVRQENGGAGSARNRALMEATCRYVAFLDADDEWLPENLERSLEAMEDGVDAVIHPVQMHRDGQVLRVFGAENESCADFRRLLFEGSHLTPSAVLVRRSAVEAADGFWADREVASAEDYDMWLRLAWRGWVVRVIPEPLTLYRLHITSASRSAVNHLRATLMVIDRHFANLEAAGRTRPGDRRRWRRARGRAIYGAGRTLQKIGQFRDALAHFGRAFREYPLQPRLFAALALLLLGPFGRRAGL